MNPYLAFVERFAELLDHGKSLPLGAVPPAPSPALPPGAPCALIFAPHPDDEVIIGGLPLRLRRELEFNVINVAVTQGSNKARQAERWTELAVCCQTIGFGLVATRENGLENINLTSRQQSPKSWTDSVQRIAAIVRQHSPHTLFVPHERDWNVTHIGTHHLVMDALKELGSSWTGRIVETEFWGAMDQPNLMVESSSKDVADLIAALTCHVGEVRRNPYHMRLPSWMSDNVRRGGELVGGQGAAAPDFRFATLYRLRLWRDGQWQPAFEGGRFVSARDSLSAMFGR